MSVPRQQVGWRLLSQLGDGLRAQFAPLILANALGRGINGRKRLVHREPRSVYFLIFRMVDLQPTGSPPGLAEAAYARARAEAIFLRRIEVKETQCDRSGTVLHASNQAASPAECDIGGSHFAFKHHLYTFKNSANGRDACSVLIAQWQMKQEVINVGDTVISQLLCQFWPDTL
jgi:hypothetical protein